MLMIKSSLERARWKKIQTMMNFLDQKKKQVRAESRQNIERLAAVTKSSVSPVNGAVTYKPSPSHHRPALIVGLISNCRVFQKDRHSSPIPPSHTLQIQCLKRTGSLRKIKTSWQQNTSRKGYFWFYSLWSLFLTLGPDSQHPCSSVLQPQEMGIS